MKRALFDDLGLPTGLFDESVNTELPPSAVAISNAEWREILDNQGRRRWTGSGLEAYEPPPMPPIAPSAISDRQFAQALALAGTITEAEALAWAARGELPQAMEDALHQIPDTNGQRFGARMMLAAATSYERSHPLTDQLGALLTNPATGKAYDATALDALWARAAAL
ncbi:hypothetical protein [Methylorubrum extorquens]